MTSVVQIIVLDAYLGMVISTRASRFIFSPYLEVQKLMRYCTILYPFSIVFMKYKALKWSNDHISIIGNVHRQYPKPVHRIWAIFSNRVWGESTLCLTLLIIKNPDSVLPGDRNLCILRSYLLITLSYRNRLIYVASFTDSLS